jgi:hypothetical protein
MSSPLRLALAAALAASASAAGKCAFQHSATRAWSVDAAKNTSALCTGTGYQWIGGYKQESYGSPTAPKRKTWWTKRLVVGETRLYFGGPPTERDMKMLCVLPSFSLANLQDYTCPPMPCTHTTSMRV